MVTSVGRMIPCNVAQRGLEATGRSEVIVGSRGVHRGKLTGVGGGTSFGGSVLAAAVCTGDEVQIR